MACLNVSTVILTLKTGWFSLFKATNWQSNTRGEGCPHSLLYAARCENQSSRPGRFLLSRWKSQSIFKLLLCIISKSVCINHPWNRLWFSLQVRDVRMISDRNSRRSKGIAYIEFVEASSVPLAIGLTGQRLLGVPIIVQASQVMVTSSWYRLQLDFYMSLNILIHCSHAHWIDSSTRLNMLEQIDTLNYLIDIN